eukprot:scaffold286977_cov31-Tisochrysis_lutea.AAC.3
MASFCHAPPMDIREFWVVFEGRREGRNDFGDADGLKPVSIGRRARTAEATLSVRRGRAVMTRLGVERRDCR